jgi:hypothetical protein
MLFMMIVKASKNSEGINTPQPHLEVMMKQYNQDLINAGVRVMAKGLHPSSEGIRFSHVKSGEEPILSYGPFEPTQDVVAGFFLIDVKTKEEAIEWARKVPDPMGNGEGQIELRQVWE